MVSSIERIRELLSSGTPAGEILQGTRVEIPGLPGATQKFKARSGAEKRFVLRESARASMAAEHRRSGKPLTGRNVLQEIGGGVLNKGEWVQITPDVAHNKTVVTGTRGIFNLSGIFRLKG